jgi:Mn2+/Fe2+ NRAMP family transporter
MRASMNAPAQPKTLLDWLRCFGPGAILASLTIGVGELVFSTRAGSLFGYRLLWFFALILFFKWLLVYSAARHIALTGVHPFQRWMELPGPRGWFPLIFLLLAVISFPIWVAFHSGTVGTLLAAMTGTQSAFNGSAHFVWGLILLAIVTALSLLGGYKTLEHAQIAIVAIMLLSVLAAFFVLRPDWPQFFAGLFMPQRVSYPDWAMEDSELRARPIWVETITYVGIIGGSAYDYLAYVSYIREKRWNRESLRIILFDSITSFVAVLVFTAVFTSLGALILRPQHQIPTGTDLLTLQTQFVTPIFPALKYLYFVGAFLAVFGTLYGTIEVAPAIWREIGMALNPKIDVHKGRSRVVLWVCVVAAFFLGLNLARGNSPALISIVTPANLFTGVLACGFVCLLSIWADFRWLDRADRMSIPLIVLNALGGVAFLGLGVKGYFDYGSAGAWMIFAGTLLGGLLFAEFMRRRAKGDQCAGGPIFRI